MGLYFICIINKMRVADYVRGGHCVQYAVILCRRAVIASDQQYYYY